MSNLLLWLDTALVVDDAAQASLTQFLMEARQWAIDHGGRMEGFAFPGQHPWWYGRPTPFQARSKPGCRVWRVAATSGVTQAVAQARPEMVLQESRVLDVREVWVPGGAGPAWFVVYRTAGALLVCLAEETEQMA